MNSMVSPQTVVVLIAVGLLLMGGEIFLPGGILGVLSGLALLAAVLMAFTIDATLGFYATLAVVVLLGISIFLWIKFFPRSSVGRKMTLHQDGRTFKASDELKELEGQSGIALSDLRPAGFARIGERRLDVVTEGSMVRRGDPVRVVKVEGNRVVVRGEAAPTA